MSKSRATPEQLAEAERIIEQLIAEGKVIRDEHGRLRAVEPPKRVH
jgi:hypothetical protein